MKRPKNDVSVTTIVLDSTAQSAVATGFAKNSVPLLVKQAGAKATKRFYEFFTANIRNRNTREAYYRALSDFFAWCDANRMSLDDLEPIVVATYVEHLGTVYAKPTVKQHLAAIRMCLDWLVVGQIIPMNPSSFVRGPKYEIGRAHV